MFDKNYKLLDAAWEAVDPTANQVGATPVVPHDYLMREYTAKEEGYVFMYVSNENATLVDVYFDDIVMTHTKSNVIQYNEYYPFGMQTANSWTRENTTGNNFLGNGGTELNTTTGVYDLHYRNYDPVLGRMTQVDPLADRYSSFSTYNFAFNDPVFWNDPLGDSPVDDANRSRNADIQRNQANTYRPIGDDMYGSMFGKAGTLGFDYSSPTPTSMWENHLRNVYGNNSVRYYRNVDLELWEHGKDYIDPNDGSSAYHHEYYYLKAVQHQMQGDPLKDFLKANFGADYVANLDKITWTLDTKEEFTKYNESEGTCLCGITKGYYDSKAGTKVQVYINPFAFSAQSYAYLIIGHEFVHAKHRSDRTRLQWNADYGVTMGHNLSEYYAYEWQLLTAQSLGYPYYGAIEGFNKYKALVKDVIGK